MNHQSLALGQRHSRALLPVLIFSGFVVSVISTLGAPLIPSIASDQGVSLETAQWVLTVTLLVGAVATPLNGRLADGPWRRHALLGSLSLVLIGAVISALSSDFTPFIAGRALQGVGQAIIPLTIATARDSLPREKVRSGIGMLSITTAAGVGLGYPLTGLLAGRFDYHAGFWFAAGVTATALLLAALVVPNNANAERRPLDWLGALLLSGGLLALLLGISQGERWGWGSQRIVTLFIAAVILLACWVLQELRVPHPLIELRLTTRRLVFAANLVALLMGIGLYANSSLINRYLQTPLDAGYGFHSSVLIVGLTLMPLSAGSIAASRLSGSLTNRLGAGRVIALGAIMMAADMLFLALSRSYRWEFVLSTFMLGVGVGLTFAMMPALIMRSVPANEMGSATGLNQVLRLVGGSIGSAASIAILTAHEPSGRSIPADHGYTVAFAVSAVLCLLAAIASVGLIGWSRPKTPDRSAAEPVEPRAVSSVASAGN